MKAIDEYFSGCPGTLYHYTGVGSLLKIVESKKLFASHAYYLNDAEEITHAASVLGQALVDYQDCGDLEEKQLLGQFDNWLKTVRQQSYGIFVFSLSEHMSLLSQWRSYTPHGKGVSLGFSQKFLNAILQESGFRLAKCIYDLDEQRELAVALVDKMFVSFRNKRDSLDLSGEHQPTRYYKFIEEFRGNLLQVFAIMKHSSFQEEREWRLISKYYPSFKGAHLKFREGASMLMPYVEIKFPADMLGQPVFDKVVLGPTQDPNLSMEALGSYLTNQDVCTRTCNSGIPYRKW